MPENTGDDDGSNNLFGKYEIGRLLGVGSSAKVYHARNLATGQSVAIKVFSKQKLLKGGHAAHIKREIGIMSRLRHPHIVKLLEVLATRNKIYFVLEFAKGGELFARVAKGRFSEDLSRRYVQQLISAVDYCHSRGVFHRDLKPENLLLDENWNLKVTDFGLSAVREQIPPDGLLRTLCGTPAYVAPEVLARRGYDGAKVDIWSCGVILYVLTAGYLPFNDTNLMAMYKKIYKGEYRCPKWMSPDLKRFLSRLLDVNPLTRITVDEIVQDPWFRKGYKEVKLQVEEPEWKAEGTGKQLSAFDIISFSPGFDLSGLFSDSGATRERFVSAESPETIMKKVDEVAAQERLTVMKRNRWAVQLAGQNGSLIIGIEILRLTEKLRVVEFHLRQRKSNDNCNGIWKDRVLPKLLGLIYRTE